MQTQAQLRSSGGTSPELRRCAQCFQLRPWPTEFMGRRGKPVQRCLECQERYHGWEYKSRLERAQARPRRRGFRTEGEPRVLLMQETANAKLGGLVSSITSPETCPDTCSWYGQGCYAEFGPLRWHWTRASRHGMSWPELCARIAALPPGTLWRYGVAGELPGLNANIDLAQLRMLLRANHRRRGFGYTHKPLGSSALAVCRRNEQAIAECNAEGFTMNLSADNLREADRFCELGIGPVVTLLRHDAPDEGNRTPAGRPVRLCFYERYGIPCSQCRRCADVDRVDVIGFRAHGQLRRWMSDRIGG
jgi:hypothetical protein